MTVLASGSKGNATVISTARTSLLVDAGLSCRELLRRMAVSGQDPAQLTAILVTHEHLDHVAGLSVLARRLGIPVFFTEATHRAWTRMMTPRKRTTYAQWLANLRAEQAARNGEMVAPKADLLPAHRVALQATKKPTRELPTQAHEEPVVLSDEEPVVLSDEEPVALLTIESTALWAEADDNTTDENASDNYASGAPGDDGSNDAQARRSARRQNPASLPAVEYFQAGKRFCIGEIEVSPFTIPHDAADPCGFVFHARSESLRMAVATDLGYIPPNVKNALREVDVLLLEANHDLEMLRDGPYPWSLKQRVLSRVGHLSNEAAAEFLTRDYDGGAHTIVLGHLSEQNNLPDLARFAAEQAIGNRLSLLGNRIVLAAQNEPLEPICL